MLRQPDAGSETPRIKTFARRQGDHYLINGQKIFTTRYQHSDMLLLLTRTTPFEQVKKKTDGMSLFLVNLKESGDTIRAVPIATMVNHGTNQLFIDDLVVPREALIGEEGKGFSYVLSSLNAERILVGSESIGDGRWFVEYGVKYANERRVFDRPIGTNQGVQFPIAKAHVAGRGGESDEVQGSGAFRRRVIVRRPRPSRSRDARHWLRPRDAK
jgi:acyl-CoA dehydrogenase